MKKADREIVLSTVEIVLKGSERALVEIESVVKKQLAGVPLDLRSTVQREIVNYVLSRLHTAR